MEQHKIEPKKIRPGIAAGYGKADKGRYVISDAALKRLAKQEQSNAK